MEVTAVAMRAECKILYVIQDVFYLKEAPNALHELINGQDTCKLGLVGYALMLLIFLIF